MNVLPCYAIIIAEAGVWCGSCHRCTSTVGWMDVGVGSSSIVLGQGQDGKSRRTTRQPSSTLVVCGTFWRERATHASFSI